MVVVVKEEARVEGVAHFSEVVVDEGSPLEVAAEEARVEGVLFSRGGAAVVNWWRY